MNHSFSNFESHIECGLSDFQIWREFFAFFHFLLIEFSLFLWKVVLANILKFINLFSCWFIYCDFCLFWSNCRSLSRKFFSTIMLEMYSMSLLPAIKLTMNVNKFMSLFNFILFSFYFIICYLIYTQKYSVSRCNFSTFLKNLHLQGFINNLNIFFFHGSFWFHG